PPGAAVGRGDGRGTRPAARTRRLRLLVGLQPRRQDAGFEFGRHHPAAVGHRAAARTVPGAPRGRSAPGKSAVTHRPAARFGALDYAPKASSPARSGPTRRRTFEAAPGPLAAGFALTLSGLVRCRTAAALGP